MNKNGSLNDNFYLRRIFKKLDISIKSYNFFSLGIQYKIKTKTKFPLHEKVLGIIIVLGFLFFIWAGWLAGWLLAWLLAWFCIS